MPCIKGERVCLREFRREDFQPMRAWANDADTVRWMSTAFWCQQTDTDVLDRLNGLMNSSHNAYDFVIADEQGEYLGEIRLFHVDWRLRCAEVSMMLAFAQDRGKGLGRKALSLLQDFAFLTLGLERLQIESVRENTAAIRCYQASGFRQEGVRRHGFYENGCFRDVVLFGMLRSDYDAIHDSESTGHPH